MISKTQPTFVSGRAISDNIIIGQDAFMLYRELR